LIAELSKRQSDNEVGPGYDGSQGVDSQDISGIDDIDYAGFQYFPDENLYGPVGSDSASRRWEQVETTIDNGIIWIDQHVKTAALFNKPSTWTGFGVVTQSNAPFFIPPNSTTVVSPAPGVYFPTDDEQGQIYSSWLNETLCKNVGGVVQYQWFQKFTPPVSPGGIGSPPVSPGGSGSTISPGGSSKRQGDTYPVASSGNSPNDGFASTPPATSAVASNAQSQTASGGFSP